MFDAFDLVFDCICLFVFGFRVSLLALGVWVFGRVWITAHFSVGFVLISCDLASQHYPTSDDYICV